MKKILIVVDMQKDFIDGSLGTQEAREIVEKVRQKILSYPKENVYATLDTHTDDYLSSQDRIFLSLTASKVPRAGSWMLPCKGSFLRITFLRKEVSVVWI